MVAVGNFYRTALGKALNKEIDFDSDSIMGALVGSGYTPNLGADDYWNDVVANEVTGTGYTANGAALASLTLTTVAANSWGVSRANSTPYVAGDVVRPATGNGFLYQALSSGTSAGTIPTYPTTIGGTVVDGGVTWLCVATGAIVLDAADPSWSAVGGSLAARYLVIYDRTPATDATRPLIALADFGSTITATNAAFGVTFDARGIAYVLVP